MQYDKLNFGKIELLNKKMIITLKRFLIEAKKTKNYFDVRLSK